MHLALFSWVPSSLAVRGGSEHCFREPHWLTRFFPQQQESYHSTDFAPRVPFIMATPRESSQPSPGGAPPEMSEVDLDEGFPMGSLWVTCRAPKALWEWAQNFGRPVVV